MSFANGKWRAPEGFGVGPVEWEHAPKATREQESSGNAGGSCEQQNPSPSLNQRQRELVRASLLHHVRGERPVKRASK